MSARVGVTSRRRLDAAVEIHRAAFEAQLHERDRRHINREVEEKIALRDLRYEEVSVVFRSQRRDMKSDAIAGGFFATALVGGDDADLLRAQIDVAKDEGEHSLTDAAEADEEKSSGESDVFNFVPLPTAVRLKREQIQLVVGGDAVGTVVAARKGLLQGHLLEKGDRQDL